MAAVSKDQHRRCDGSSFCHDRQDNNNKTKSRSKGFTLVTTVWLWQEISQKQTPHLTTASNYANFQPVVLRCAFTLRQRGVPAASCSSPLMHPSAERAPDPTVLKAIIQSFSSLVSGRSSPTEEQSGCCLRGFKAKKEATGWGKFSEMQVKLEFDQESVLKNMFTFRSQCQNIYYAWKLIYQDTNRSSCEADGNMPSVYLTGKPMQASHWSILRAKRSFRLAVLWSVSPAVHPL